MLTYFQVLRKSKFRQVIWPIKSSELRKFIPMALLMFVILLNQNIIRSIRDNLVTTMIGPEILSFIKLWCEMPIGILFVVIYSRMCNHMSTELVFRSVVVFFLAFFWLFAFYMFPNTDFLHPSATTINYYTNLLPNFKWFIALWANWTYVLFYVLGELWPVVVFSLLFWQLANHITKTEEAKRFYSFFSVFGQSNLLISGGVLYYFSSPNWISNLWLAGVTDNVELMLKSLIIVVLISGGFCLLLHKLIEVIVILPSKNSIVKQDKPKLGFRESIKTLASSKYLWFICLILISYSMSINLMEGLLLAKVKQLYPNPKEFMIYQGQVSFWTGVFTLLFSVIGSNIIRKFGWLTAATLTPLMIFINGLIFFIAVLTENELVTLLSLQSVSALHIIVVIAALQGILGKSTKYSLFDATKEMLYIPLNNEMKTKGKAAVEIMGAKLGKASGSIIQCVIFFVMPQTQYSDIAALLLVFFTMICSIWLYVVFRLNNKYKELLA
ncbi:MAG: NTP/NDP exchange transporter [Rickettsiaceae bacterium]|nr:NTP/NDP exchange transporter [Rickettsiaceae bacterium]